MQHIRTETFDLLPTGRSYTDNGFLRVTGRAARTGVYKYLASELLLKDREPNDIVNVLRHADDVFNTQSMASYSNVDVTNDHPSDLVNADSFKLTSVGHVISAKRSGDFVEVDMIIKDATAIKDVEAGKVQLSPGYEVSYTPEKGVYTATGENYEFVQRDIKINHIAICNRARAGIQARINDSSVLPVENKLTVRDAFIQRQINASHNKESKTSLDVTPVKSKLTAREYFIQRQQNNG